MDRIVSPLLRETGRHRSPLEVVGVVVRPPPYLCHQELNQEIVPVLRWSTKWNHVMPIVYRRRCREFARPPMCAYSGGPQLRNVNLASRLKVVFRVVTPAFFLRPFLDVDS